MAEIRAFREAYAEKFDGDIEAIVADIEKRTRESGRTTVSLPPKRISGGSRSMTIPKWLYIPGIATLLVLTILASIRWKHKQSLQTV